MSWRTEWRSISAQIQGLVDSGKFYLEVLHSGSADAHEIGNQQLIPRAQNIYKIIKKFSANYESTLPSPVNECLTRFITNYTYLFCSNGDALSPAIRRPDSPNVQKFLTVLVLLKSELTYYLSDFSAVAKRLSERAFLHLQRSIVVDLSVKQQWLDAFNLKGKKAEIACEKLGGVHLLLHGIWAFKAYTPKERTDLVLQEPIRDFDEVKRTAEALVLTEWKIVRKASEWEQKAKEARRQASRYESSVLGGIELGQYRYLVLVSEKDWPSKIQDFPDGDIVYRHINIVVDPDPPSQAERRKKS